MAVPSRHGRHWQQQPRRARHRSRRAAPLAAFAVVLVLTVAAGVAGALGARDGGAPAAVPLAGTGAAGAGTAGPGQSAPAQSAPATTTPRADRASRRTRQAPVPTLGRVAAAATAAPSQSGSAMPGAPAPSSGASSTPTGDPTASAAPADSGLVAEVTRLTNAERAKAGCGALRTDSRLAAAAAAHSKDMVDRDYFDHTSPDGKGPGDRAAAAGYPRWSGENIAAGYSTAAAVVQGWMNSPGHKANIVNCDSTATGVGYDERKKMWTQMFGFE